MLKQTFLGFYRVNYNQHNWLLLQKQLQNNYSVIPITNRAQILNDALELAALDYVDYKLALNLTKYLINEDAYMPWVASLQSFRKIRLIIANTHYEEIFKVVNHV